MHTLPIAPPAKPWHREPWPWLLMLGPLSVIVAGVITTVIAFRGADGLVAEDYYKQGLAINRVLARERRAAALAVTARLPVLSAGEPVRLSVTAAAPLPAVLSLRLVHPSRAGQDQTLLLRQTGEGHYQGGQPLPPGRWLLALETPDWRISGVLEPGRGTQLDSGVDAAK